MDLADLRTTASLLGFHGEVVTGVRFATSTCTAVVQPDPAETARRRSVHLSPLRDHRLVEVLAQLPLGGAVPWTAVDPIMRAVLDCAPHGVVRADASHVERLWRPALTVRGVLVATDDWRAGLEAVGVFALDAPRGLMLARHPRDLASALTRARRFGIGMVVRGRRDGWELASPPGAARRVRPGPRHWRFLEAVYAAWQGAGYEPEPAQALR